MHNQLVMIGLDRGRCGGGDIPDKPGDIERRHVELTFRLARELERAAAGIVEHAGAIDQTFNDCAGAREALPLSAAAPDPWLFLPGRRLSLRVRWRPEPRVHQLR